MNCHTENTSKYFDHCLQPIVKKIPSYVKGTQEFFKKLEKVKDIPQESLLVTLDVKSLYINIPNNKGIKAVKTSHEKNQEKTVFTEVIISFLSLILTLNNFALNCRQYLQTMSCGMNTICAQTCANILTVKFEQNKSIDTLKKV